MRYSRSETAAKHEKILQAAARMFREQGFGSVSVAQIMQSAGMTHGAFYAHFSSKDALAAEAVGHAMAQLDEQRQAPLDQSDPLAAFSESYLTAQHRDDPGNGCAIAALGPSIARNPKIAGPFTEQIQQSLARLAPHIDGVTAEQGRRQAIHTLSTAVGAMIIARAVSDPALSDEILASARDSLSQAGSE
ncbi:TetR/AcrR family transcriptional regulator [Saccharospirillum sp. HFRX-1]|uniref:TetR/AcrR family transcriptional regulator n=1 Tax=unclassified Saccharospirillum TaxID=2633430 RepID=UPI0037111D86